jgi:hypothetical protein
LLGKEDTSLLRHFSMREQLEHQQLFKHTDCTKAIIGRLFSVAIAVTRFCFITNTLAMFGGKHCRALPVNSFQAPPLCVGTCDSMRHGLPLQRYSANVLINCPGLGYQYLTVPIPTMRLAQGEESGRPNPANVHNSRNGDSGSRRRAILSRAIRKSGTADLSTLKFTHQAVDL